ncbi:MAG: SRPBCC domain-containing protein, partial [Thermoplasmata archaeon]
MVDITKTVEIGTGPGEVFSAVTTQEGLRGWWTRQAIAEPRAGHVNQFPFSSGDFNAMRVVALEPDHRVEWECVEGADEWVGTRVMFDIAPA